MSRKRKVGILLSAATLVFGFAALKGCGGGGGSKSECNNGIVEGSEECDGVDLNGASCTSLGHGAGSLSCNADCTFNEAQCYSCGNNVAEGPEACDGADLKGQTCQSLNYDGGTLACTASCTFDETGCTTADTCGDGNISGNEECDGTNLDNTICEDLGFRPGTNDPGLACTTTDCQFDTSGCGPQVMSTCATSGNKSIPATGTLTCPTETGTAIQWDWYSVQVQAGDCVDIAADNGTGAADLVAFAMNTDQNQTETYIYGLVEDYTELDDEMNCTVAPWDQYGCPAAKLEAGITGEFLILVGQWAGNGTNYGTDTCNQGMSDYTLFVAVNGTDASPVLVQNDTEIQ